MYRNTLRTLREQNRRVKTKHFARPWSRRTNNSVDDVPLPHGRRHPRHVTVLVFSSTVRARHHRRRRRRRSCRLRRYDTPSLKGRRRRDVGISPLVYGAAIFFFFFLSVHRTHTLLCNIISRARYPPAAIYGPPSAHGE